MRRSKLVLALALSAVTTTALMVACSFPSVTFAPEEAGSSSGATSGGTSGGSVGDADDLAPGPDGSSPDAEAGAEPPKGDAGIDDAPPIVVPPGQDAAGCCDCDGDGFYHQVGACNGMTPTDCDDSDTLVNSGRKWTTAAPDKWLGDWNCNGRTEKYYTEGIKCAQIDLSTLLGTRSCSDFVGFHNTVPCGATGNYVHCVKPGGLPLTCAVGATDTTIKQQCQ